MSHFNQKIYDLLIKVPAGQVTTYKALAENLGTRAYQAVGNALKNNPDAPRIPCHRVVKSNGKIGGFNGQTTGMEIKRKIKLLEKEGVLVKQGEVCNLSKIFFDFS
ncbi:MAG: MGMT family protein [Candidatus Pacebacteria bacterium]|jgi:methylated-DNA-[protein]-cysteine S-methyltransferase|nr:MGMT family protein [Candidatus Paceibacterota bacterium]MBT3511557.1 MGMT family protein [Candidatus Paceibacterota bacterium]MBT4004973.1 MGMT family protein [Candidatus Paceibacterota bacterium]MBT4358749.1 MGMT family protein [Candidatus Paceibacterota bacterium]MBT4680916.1 MGMT family protein [Candidatus Paceibacterota bacterium]